MSRPAISRALRREVMLRAVGRCEYCRGIAAYETFAFHIDHVVAIQHGGSTVADNLAYCCALCNVHKGTNLSNIDPATGRVVRLYNPRTDRWGRHSEWQASRLVGRTSIGRATVVLLRANAPEKQNARASLMREGLF